MKKLLMLWVMLQTLEVSGQQYSLVNGKRIIDTSVLSSVDWNKLPSMGGSSISPDGKYIFYVENNQPAGSSTLTVLSVDKHWKKELLGVSSGNFTEDSRQFILPFSDSSGILTLGTDNVHYRPHKVTVEKKQIEENIPVKMYSTVKEQGSDKMYALHWASTATGEDKVIYESREEITKYSFDNQKAGVAFWSSGGIWYYHTGMDSATELVNNQSAGIDGRVELDSKGDLEFNKAGNRVLFFLREKQAIITGDASKGVQVDVWHYQDADLQSQQLAALSHSGPQRYAALVNIGEHRVLRIEQEGERFSMNRLTDATNYILEAKARGVISEWWWKQGDYMKTWLVSLKDGSRKLLPMSDILSIGGDPIWSSSSSFEQLSPDEQYILFYNRRNKCYESYEIATGIVRNLTKELHVSWEDPFFRFFPYPNPMVGEDIRLRFMCSNSVSPISWMKDGLFYLADSYDIWKIDLSGRQKPVNMTRNYGRLHHLVFRFASNITDTSKECLLAAYDPTTHYEGYYKLSLTNNSAPQRLIMGPYANVNITKAEKAGVWLVTTNSLATPLCLSVTKDFQTFIVIKKMPSPTAYNWYTSELVSWKLPNGETCLGALYKPEDLDTTKKYPIIFNYYEALSAEVYAPSTPEWAASTNINIPYFCSRGYLVFMPDMHYSIGHPLRSAMECVIGAVKALSKRPYVDTKHMGLAGHSWGAFETNYITAHSHLFTAAAEGAGGSDFMSSYGGFFGDGANQFNYEVSQARVGASLWQRPDLYIENSMIFQANKITTPLLILHNKGDRNVAWGQGVELYMAMRRLGKPCWMLQYDGETHSLSKEQNIKDYTIRLTQFFDHYLKGAPAPVWMSRGVPARLKGIDSGLEIDSTHAKP